MTGTRTGLWGYALVASVAFLMSGAVALSYAGGIADEYHVDDVPVALWAIFGTGVVGLVFSLPIVLAKKRTYQR